MDRSDLISDRYSELNTQLHKKGFGASGHRWVDHVKLILDVHRVFSLLDYGCGKSAFWGAFKKKYGPQARDIRYREYDPCIAGKDTVPNEVYDMVVCTDVMEHIEPKYLDNVTDHIISLIGKVAFFNIATRPADKALPDGRNTHLIVKPGAWWRGYLEGRLGSGGKISHMASKRVKDINLLVETAL